MSTALHRFGPLPPAMTEAEVERCPFLMLEEDVKSLLFNITTMLLDHLQQPNSIFGDLDPNPSEPSLQTLYKRLKNNDPAPSLIKGHRKVEALVKERLRPQSFKMPLDRSLEDYEDLFYALVARIRDLHGTLTMHLTHFVPDPDRMLFPASNITMATFHDQLIELFALLNNVALVAALHNAVKRGRAKATHDWRLIQLEKHEITQTEFDMLMNRIYDPPPYGDIDGMEFIAGNSSAMICARLQEKYRVFLQLESRTKEKAARWERKQMRLKKVLKKEKAKGKERDARGRSDSEGRRRRISEERRTKRLSKKRSKEMVELDQMMLLEKKQQERSAFIDAQRQQYLSNAAAQRYSQEQTIMMQLYGMNTPTTPGSAMSFTSLVSPVGVAPETEWQTRMEDVSEYTQYMEHLRGAASNTTRQMVDDVNVNVRQSLESPSEPGSADMLSNFPQETSEQYQTQTESQMPDRDRQSMSSYSSSSVPAQVPSQVLGQVPDNARMSGQNQQSLYVQSSGQSQWQWPAETTNKAENDFYMGGVTMGKTHPDVFEGVAMAQGWHGGYGDVSMGDSEF